MLAKSSLSGALFLDCYTDRVMPSHVISLTIHQEPLHHQLPTSDAALAPVLQILALQIVALFFFN